MSIQEDLASKRKRAHNPFVIREGKFRDAPLEDSFYHLDWAEESFLSGDHEKEMLRRTFDLSKLKYIIGLVTLAMIIILIRVFWLQVVRGGHYYSMAEGNRIRAEIIEPRRGIIYDCNFRPLVRNEANFLLYLVPTICLVVMLTAIISYGKLVLFWMGRALMVIQIPRQPLRKFPKWVI
jgi:hypothetical protein